MKDKQIQPVKVIEFRFSLSDLVTAGQIYYRNYSVAHSIAAVSRMAADSIWKSQESEWWTIVMIVEDVISILENKTNQCPNHMVPKKWIRPLKKKLRI
jgi:hypothetical protein